MTTPTPGPTSPTPTPPSPTRYRVGNHVGRTIYRDDDLIGVMDDRADAARIVELLNTYGP